MQSFKIAVQERNFRILDEPIDLTQQMVEGEPPQLEKLGRSITLDEHFDLIHRKTACLFSTCTRLGAIVSDASAEHEESWHATAAAWAWRFNSWTTRRT